ncbi:anti-sigma factor domain-containing protein [Cryobacterium breve]|uniref:anti-sigma factor domain-containing protein n=1 Tax=Cryobacterium breve TaxID=1259258 RepID=UPI003D7C1611
MAGERQRRGRGHSRRAPRGRRRPHRPLRRHSGGSLREVWLIKADASGLISIGLLDGNTGHFDIPDDVDLAQYPLVDVSAEPDNGNPAHSGNSIVRGELHAT